MQNDSFNIEPGLQLPLKCIDSVSGTKSDCAFNTVPTPTWNETHCINMMMEIEYHVKYSINTNVEISEVNVAFVFGDAATGVDGSSSLRQMFSYKFDEVCIVICVLFSLFSLCLPNSLIVIFGIYSLFHIFTCLFGLFTG